MVKQLFPQKRHEKKLLRNKFCIHCVEINIKEEKLYTAIYSHFRKSFKKKNYSIFNDVIKIMKKI